MRLAPCFVSATCAGVLFSCVHRTPAPILPDPVSSVPVGAAVPKATARLVVLIVLDQLASWVLDKYLPVLDENGALRRGVAQGAFHRVSYPYSSTYTAPGHAALVTGAPPADNGIMANELYDRAMGKPMPCASDPSAPVLLDPEATASPAVLKAQTVGDALWEATRGKAHVVSISLKDRSAVLSGGKHAELALFYDPAIGAYTTSEYYAKALPDFLTAWSAAHPIGQWLAAWTPLDAGLLARVAGKDDAPGEGDWEGLGTTFPHDPRTSAHPNSTFRATPQATEELFALASEVVDRTALGQDDVPDFLVVSVSGTDYIGHVFGPDSWEYLDNLRRVDRALASFVDRLSAKGPTAFLITADHGVVPLPERTLAEGHPAGRLLESDMKHALADAAARELGHAEWVVAVKAPFVYLAPEATTPERRSASFAVIRRALESMPGIFATYDVKDLAAHRASDDPIYTAASLSVDASLDADLLFIPRQGYLVDSGIVPGKGTSHGTPWPYDREVPVIFWGAGVTPHAKSTETFDALRVAPTLAALLGSPRPSSAHGDPLPGAPPLVAAR